MNKKASLDFLQSCMDKINTASEEDVHKFKEKYDYYCNNPVSDSNFDFVVPTKERIEISNEIIRKKTIIQETEFSKSGNYTNLEYDFRKFVSINQQNSSELPFAA